MTLSPGARKPRRPRGSAEAIAEGLTLSFGEGIALTHVGGGLGGRLKAGSGRRVDGARSRGCEGNDRDDSGQNETDRHEGLRKGERISTCPPKRRWSACGKQHHMGGN